MQTGGFVKIVKIITVGNTVLLLVNNLEVANSNFTKHLKIVREHQPATFIYATEISEKIVYIKTNKQSLLSKFPNTIESD